VGRRGDLLGALPVLAPLSLREGSQWADVAIYSAAHLLLEARQTHNEHSKTQSTIRYPQSRIESPC
jgi:hypothetical protein